METLNLILRGAIGHKVAPLFIYEILNVLNEYL